MDSQAHELVLIPWHIGDLHDITLNAARAARRLRVFLAEEPEETERMFREDLGVDCREKKFLAIPERESEPFFAQVRDALRSEDVGLICSSGIPCFLDPGAWVVRRLRGLEIPVRALPGASILSTLLSLSGLDWTQDEKRGTFAFFLGGPSRKDILTAVSRQDEAVFVFLAAERFRECIEFIGPEIGERPISAFFDLSKGRRSPYSYADRVMTMDRHAWLREASSIRWSEIADVSLMIHPRKGGA